MPVVKCTKDDKPGWKWGSGGFCYTYTAGSKRSSGKAKQKAYLQGVAIEARKAGKPKPKEK